MADTQERREQDEPASIDIPRAKQRLLDMQDELEHSIGMKEAQVAEGGDDLVPERCGVSNHMADDADETTEQETMMSLQQSLEDELGLVRSALVRIEEGTYGTCANCGKRIGAARLEARPSAMYCIDCQELADAGRL